MKQAPGGAGDPVPAVLPGATQQPPCLRFAEGPPPTPIRPIFFGYAKKNLSSMGNSPGSCVKVG